jgi:tripartite-type tricarboxylate transporter receptor subunit TctC
MMKSTGSVARVAALGLILGVAPFAAGCGGDDKGATTGQQASEDLRQNMMQSYEASAEGNKNAPKMDPGPAKEPRP